MKMWTFTLAVLYFGHNVKAQITFEDTGILTSLINGVDKDKNGKISQKNFVDYFMGGKDGSYEIASTVFRMIDQDGDNEANKEEIFDMIKKIIEVYIKLFDINKDGSLSEKELLKVSINVDEAIKDAQMMGQILLNLIDINKDGVYSEDDHENSNKILLDDVKILGLLKKALDQNEDHKLGKEEIKVFANTAIKLIDRNSDGTILLEELFNTLEQNNFSKKTVDYLRAQSKNKTIINAWRSVFQKVDAQTKDKNGKLSPDEVAALINLSSGKLSSIGGSIYEMNMNPNNQMPLNSQDLDMTATIESFLKNKEFEKVNSIVNREPENPEQKEPFNSSTVKRVNSFLFVFLFFKTFGALIFNL